MSMFLVGQIKASFTNRLPTGRGEYVTGGFYKKGFVPFVIKTVPILYGAIDKRLIRRVHGDKFKERLADGSVRQLPNGQFEGYWTYNRIGQMNFLTALNEDQLDRRCKIWPRDRWERSDFSVFDVLRVSQFWDPKHENHAFYLEVVDRYPHGCTNLNLLTWRD